MKHGFPSGWGDSKRKGKERAMDSSQLATTSDATWAHSVHGLGYCDGTCQPGPSCALFPRRPDGKVMLPDPKDGSKTTLKVVKPENFSGMARHMPPPPDPRPRNYHYPEPETLPREPEAATAPESQPSPRTHTIENYAQLSCLPEFKAFKMDHDGRENKNSRQSSRQQGRDATEGRISASKSSSSSPTATANVDAEWQQWKMREIRVVKRRRKQEYIRSGTHDFSIRLWSNYEE